MSRPRVVVSAVNSGVCLYVCLSVYPCVCGCLPGVCMTCGGIAGEGWLSLSRSSSTLLVGRPSFSHTLPHFSEPKQRNTCVRTVRLARIIFILSVVMLSFLGWNLLGADSPDFRDFWWTLQMVFQVREDETHQSPMGVYRAPCVYCCSVVVFFFRL